MDPRDVFVRYTRAIDKGDIAATFAPRQTRAANSASIPTVPPADMALPHFFLVPGGFPTFTLL